MKLPLDKKVCRSLSVTLISCICKSNLSGASRLISGVMIRRSRGYEWIGYGLIFGFCSFTLVTEGAFTHNQRCGG